MSKSIFWEKSEKCHEFVICWECPEIHGAASWFLFASCLTAYMALQVDFFLHCPTDIGLQLGRACYPVAGKGRGVMFYFFCFFTFIPVPLSSLSLSFISSAIYLLSLFSLSLGDDTKWPTRVDLSLNLNSINQKKKSLFASCLTFYMELQVYFFLHHVLHLWGDIYFLPVEPPEMFEKKHLLFAGIVM